MDVRIPAAWRNHLPSAILLSLVVALAIGELPRSLGLLSPEPGFEDLVAVAPRQGGHCPQAGSYNFYPQLDVPSRLSYDFMTVDAPLDVASLAERCNKMPPCVAFNTKGESGGESGIMPW